MDTVNALMDFEDGTLDDAGTLELFSHLITTGMAWNLQGSYGRMAQGFIDAGYIDPDGFITDAGDDLLFEAAS